MAIPDFQSIMRPLLVFLSDGQDRSVQTIRETLAQQFGLTEEELAERLPSDRDLLYRNRVGVGSFSPQGRGRGRVAATSRLPHH